MLNKIFLAALALSVLVTSALTFFSYSWLQSIDKPDNVIANFDAWSGFTTLFLAISAVALLVFANVLLWTNRNIWSLWSTFLYFIVFVLINAFWISNVAWTYKTTNNLATGYSFSAILGALLCVLAGVAIFFDQFIVLRLRDKMYGRAAESTPVKDVSVVAESDPVESEQPETEDSV